MTSCCTTLPSPSASSRQARDPGKGAASEPGQFWSRGHGGQGHGPQLHHHLVIVVEDVALETRDGVVAASILGLQTAPSSAHGELLHSAELELA